MDRERNIQVKQVHFYQIKHILGVATILNQCGKDMADKYDLHHWDNPMFKSVLIVCMRLLENKVFLVVEGKCPVATFQIREEKDALFFEKISGFACCIWERLWHLLHKFDGKESQKAWASENEDGSI